MARQKVLKHTLKKGDQDIIVEATALEYEFCWEYVKNRFNGTQAILTVYNVEKTKTAEVMASKMLKKPRVMNLITTILADVADEEDIKREMWKDVMQGNPTARSKALHMLAQTQAMLADKRINVQKQKDEYGDVIYDTYQEAKSKSNKRDDRV